MPRSKNYRSKAGATPVFDVATALPVETTLNYAEESGGRRNPTSTRSIDFSSWIDTPYEQWARAWLGTLRYLIKRGDVAIASCVKLGTIHRVFFTFLGLPQLAQPPGDPRALQPRHITLFRQWLTASFPQNTAQNYYKHVKTIGIAMIELGLVDGYQDEYFPRNAMRRGPTTHAAVALSDPELERVVAALKRDLIDLHKGTFAASNVQAITVYFLVLAMRTGGNPTPLLELTRGGLKPHVLPGMMRIDLVKHRAANTYPNALRGPIKIEGVLSVPNDGVAILTRVLEITKSLSAEAGPNIRDRIWLYETQRNDRRVVALEQQHIDKSIRTFVKRHGLRGDDGAPLRLNLSRLRKTKAQKLFKLSGGDLATVAMLLGNTAAVVGQNYMNMTPALRAEGAQFVGEVFEKVLSGSKDEAAPTPVGKCKDTLHGAHAPKDGTRHCDQFLHCLSCPSFAIAGTVADLHRLFSFQIYLRAEIDYYPSDPEYEEWRAHRQRLVGFVDTFTTRHFPEQLVSQARELAEREPHKFWAIQLKTLQRIGALRG